MQALLNQPEIVITAFLCLFVVFLVTILVTVGRSKNKTALLQAQYLQEKAGLEEKLADTELYEERQKAELLKLLAEQTSLQQQYSDHEEKLLSAMTALEEMEAEFTSS